MAEDKDEVMRPDAPNRQRSDEIREEIGRTRMELEETVDEIEARLDPGNLAQEGWEKVKTSTEAGAKKVVRLAREHPIPLSLIGVGVTWLMIDRARRRSAEEWGTDRDLEDYGDVAASAGRDYGKEGRRVTDQARDTMSKAKQAASDAADRVSDTTSHAARRITDAANQAGRKVSDVAGSVKDRAVDLGHRTSERVGRARESFWDLVDRRPLAAGMATLAAGVLIGLLIPSTRREDELMGETRDELLRGAGEKGRETFEKTKEVARTAADAAQHAAESEAQRQNLMPGR